MRSSEWYHNDSENELLHATLLIDTTGKQRWQDVSWQPFSDTKFILAEAKHLLELNTTQELTSLRPAP